MYTNIFVVGSRQQLWTDGWSGTN